MTRTLEQHPNVTLVRGEVEGLPPEDWGGLHRRHRPAHRARPSPRGSKALAGEPNPSPSSTPSRRSSTATRSTWTSRGSSPATTSPGQGGTRPITSTARWTREQYDTFVAALVQGEKIGFKQWEGTRYFEGCLPIEVMAERGREPCASAR